MKILLDMDDVMVDLIGPWLDYLNNKHGSNISKDDVFCWDMNECVLPKLLECDAEENIHIFEPLFIPEFWDNVKPLEGAVDAIKELNEKHSIYIATASHHNTFGPKIEKCLLKYFPFISEKQIICIYRKELIDAGILIDDNYDNIEKFALSSGNKSGILMNAPYNKDMSIKNTPLWNKVFRVDNWNDIIRFFNL